MGNWNRDIFQGRCRQLAADVRQRWAMLREDHRLWLLAGSDRLLGALQERYGRERAMIHLRVRRIERDL